MKLLYQKEKYIKHSRSAARRAQKRRSFKKKKQKSVRRSTLGMSRKERHDWHTQQRYDIVIKAPENLAFLDDPDSVVKCINKLESAIEKHSSLYVHMKYVKKIDYTTIAAFLAVLYRARQKGLKVNGNMPADNLARDILAKSGFIYTLFNKSLEDIHRHDITVDNQLFTLDTRDLGVVSEIQKAVSECILGQEKKIPGLYTTLGELMDNTASHAAEIEGETERWWVSINYDRIAKKVEFVFVDYGVGIFTSLTGKTNKHHVKIILKKAQQRFGLEATEKHLQSIVTQSARKTYKLSGGHGQGIYGIYQAMQRAEIGGLHIISNNAFGAISTANYKRLKQQLNGTIYYWEVGVNNV